MEKAVKKNMTEKIDAVKTFRKIKDKISKDTWGLSYDELKMYFNRKLNNNKVAKTPAFS